MTERTDKTDVMKIDNLDAPELDLYARLSETELLRLNEPDRGVFIAESPRVIERALQAGCVPISILCEERQAEEVQVRAVPQAPAKPAPVSRAPQQPGGKKGIVNIDSLSRAFAPGDVVTVAAMQQRKLLKPGVGIVKVLARGALDKPLIVEAHDFSLDAVKMILLTGGKVHRLHRSGGKEQ